MRSPTSTRGLPSIGEGQPPFYSFTPFDGLRRQPLQNFLSSLKRLELGRKEGEELLAFTTILSSKNHRIDESRILMIKSIDGLIDLIHIIELSVQD